MDHTLQPIHFRVKWQVIGPDSPGQQFTRDPFQAFFADLNSNKELGGYDDFSHRPGRCELTRTRGSSQYGGQSFSKILYEPDALTVVEEYATESIDEFARKMKIVLDHWFKSFPGTVIVLQNSCIRCLVAPASADNSRLFLSSRVLHLEDSFTSRLSELPQSVGFHFSSQRHHAGVPMNLDAKISSWRDNRSVWIEVNSNAPMPRPLNAVDHDAAESVFDKCRIFLTSEVIPLLRDFDRTEVD